MPLVTGTDAYGRPVFGVPAIPNAPINAAPQQQFAAPQLPQVDYSGLVARLQAIKGQGTDATARTRYAQQQILQKRKLAQSEQDVSLAATTEASATGARKSAAGAAQKAQDQADQIKQQNAQAAIATVDQNISNIVTQGFEAANVIDLKMNTAAKQTGSSVGTTNTQGKTDLRSRIVALIAKQKGIKYSWGGGNKNGPSEGFAQGDNIVGFDCSSLVQYAYGKMGIKMPRTSGPQAKMGVKVPLDKLKPGDLVAKPGHIAVYAGNGMMWEAPHTGAVVRFVPVRKNMYGVHLKQLGE